MTQRGDGVGSATSGSRRRAAELVGDLRVGPLPHVAVHDNELLPFAQSAHVAPQLAVPGLDIGARVDVVDEEALKRLPGVVVLGGSGAEAPRSSRVVGRIEIADELGVWRGAAIPSHDVDALVPRHAHEPCLDVLDVVERVAPQSREKRLGPASSASAPGPRVAAHTRRTVGPWRSTISWKSGCCVITQESSENDEV